MAFSPDGRLLLAVSRDRTWSLWRREDPGADGSEACFSLYTRSTKDSAVHTRIIWSCDWSPDNKYFATSSRDKKVIMWGHHGSATRVGENNSTNVGPCSSVLDVGDSATAVAVCPFLLSDQSYLLAVGLESGKIVLYKWRPVGDLFSGSDWSKCAETDASQSHTLVVKRLCWRPRPGQAGQRDESESQSKCSNHDWVQLASAGADHAVKIFNVNTQTL